ncbi:hypothetical protein [Streptomyces olivaceus]|uniref:hypothetical protein n=1 Tax=Streptomyces olivaceus TaxID=47716 RepID=UPI001885158A|nr:hypothetical protein [Streptomyces olivaceus]MBZ6141509.1 hypothetical protein [Streptomyces olivaceus]MBZ6169501.1 hypothetical protein [Streptomyces olivaceus]MBZ6174488.1 hypothetical protein [Streptomyces olivaceus]MBZ6180666.1 hypothetical protein [Streptomyces olivaceus]MBZ6258745.1 hypothetical protein [Streptomyces olivaceus]
MHLSAELIGGGVTLVGLGILTYASVRSIGRRGTPAESWHGRPSVHVGDELRRP